VEKRSTRLVAITYSKPREYKEYSITETTADPWEPEWKYNEKEILEELLEYCRSTYKQHYAQNEIQASEFISSSGKGLGFFLGNAIKYSDRYGKKDGYNRKDLMKAVHYLIMAIWEHDKQWLDE
jgi:hypothetical protein